MICPTCGSKESRPVHGELVREPHGVKEYHRCRCCGSHFVVFEFSLPGDNGAARLTLLSKTSKECDALIEIVKSAL